MRPDSRAYIASIATVVPPFSAGQEFAAELLRRHYSDKLSPRGLKLLRAVLSHPSIRKRHFAIDDPICLITETPDQRIARFTESSLDLSCQAILQALEQAGLTVKDVQALVVNTCTGYICPGLSTYLVERLELPRTVRAFDLVGSGCGGAIPNLQLCESLIAAGCGVVVSVSVEICSALFQMEDDLSLILSNALFGDGAAAAVLWQRPQGLEVIETANRLVPEQREHIRLVHKQGQLYNQLSLELPHLVDKAAAEVVADLVGISGLTVPDVRHWAMHTGGEKVIDAVGDAVGLTDQQLWATRKVLSEYGNMSSPTVWFVLNEILQAGMTPGDLCMMVSYGAGLSAYGCLLRN